MHAGLFISEKDVVFSMGLVIVDHVAAGNISGFYAPMCFYMSTLR
jgi:hypothetical protein